MARSAWWLAGFCARVRLGAAAVFGVCSGLLAPVSPGFLIGLPSYGGYLLLAAVVRAEVTAQPAS